MPPIRQPIPITKKLQSRSFSFSPRQSSPLTMSDAGPHQAQATPLDQEYDAIAEKRCQHYSLDVPLHDAEAIELLNAPDSRFYAAQDPHEPLLQHHLPYEIESLQDKARYLSHIVSHLYIAVKSLDLQGLVSINARDLELAKTTVRLGGHQLEAELAAEHSFEGDYDDGDSEDDSDDDAYDDDDDSDDGAIENGASTPVNNVKLLSAAIINARHWSIELHTLLQMEFPVPLLLRLALCKVYYLLCLAEGQGECPAIFSSVFAKLVDRHAQPLKQMGLVLDWQLLYKRCLKYFPHEDGLFDGSRKGKFARLLSVCLPLSQFFAKELLPVIVDHVLAKFSSANSLSVMGSLYALMPMSFEPAKDRYSPLDVRYYVPVLLNVWASTKETEYLDVYLVALLARISEHALIATSADAAMGSEGDFGILSRHQLVTLFDNLTLSFNFGPMKRSNYPRNFYQSFAKLVVNNIVANPASERSTLHTLGSFLNSIRSFVHPSNSGAWSSGLSYFVECVVAQYVKRNQLEKDDPVNNLVPGVLVGLPKERKLNLATHRQLSQMVFPLCQTGIQGKSTSDVDRYIVSISLLCLIAPNYVLDAVLIDCYTSFETLTSSHRLRAVLKEFAAVVRFLVELPVYRVHVVRILTNVLPGIDSNDLVKSLQTLHLIAVTASFVPFAVVAPVDSVDFVDSSVELSPLYSLDFTDQHLAFLEQQFLHQHQDLPEFVYDPAYEQLALLASTSQFNELLKTYCERLFLLLENLPDPKKTSGLEAKMVSFAPRAFAVVVESCSDDCFRYLCETVFALVSDKVLYTVADCVGHLVAVLVKRDPARELLRWLPFLVGRISEELEENGAGTLRSSSDELPPRDQPLFWYTVLLSGVISHAGEHLLPHRATLERLLLTLLLQVKGPSGIVTSLVFYNLFSTVTTTRLKESRLVAPGAQLTVGSWGGSQFDASRFSAESLDSFQWHVPSAEEILFAIDQFDKFGHHLMGSVSESLSGALAESGAALSGDLALTDKLHTELLALGHCLAGMSHLFDPAYSQLKDASKPSALKGKLDVLQVLRSRLDSEKVDSSDTLSRFGSSDTLGKSDSNTLMSPGKISSADTDVETELEMVEPQQHTHAADSDDYIEASDPNEDAIMEDDTNGTVPEIPISGKLTPRSNSTIGESLDAVLSFQNRKIYNVNYHFGDRNKESSVGYVKVHELREEIGQFLHRVCEFLLEHQPNNTKLFKVLLHTYKIWICDVGREKVLNLEGSWSLKFGYLESIQFIRRLRKPFTRIGFGLLLEKKHRERLLLFAGARFLTSTDRLLLADVVALSSSAYSLISRAANSALNRSMKVLLGSYSVLIKQVMLLIRRAIDARDIQSLENSLVTLNSSRIRKRLLLDYANLSGVVQLLNECMLIETNAKVDSLAAAIFSDIVNRIRIASSVCELDECHVNAVKPPDEYAEFEIRAVLRAKNLKRAVYRKQLNQLSQALVDSVGANKFWKVNHYNLALLINIQASLETEIHPAMMSTLLQFMTGSHPSIFRLCLKGFAGIFEKLYLMSVFHYDLKQMCLAEHHPEEVVFVDTRPVEGANYQTTFRREMANFDQPLYFIDNKRNQNHLFWGDQMTLVRNISNGKWHLQPRESQILAQFGLQIDSQLVLQVLKLLVQEAEHDGGFHTNDVALIGHLIHLSGAGYTSKFDLTQLFELVEQLYDPDDKDVHLVVCETMLAMLVTKSHASDEFIARRDSFVAAMLRQVLAKDISPETRGIWVVFSWWVPGNADLRRFPETAEVLTSFHIDKHSDSLFLEASKLMMLKNLIASLANRFPNVESLYLEVFQTLDHPYQLVREQLALVLTGLFLVAAIEPAPDSHTFLQQSLLQVGKSPQVNPILHNELDTLFEYLNSHRPDKNLLSAQEILKTPYFYTARTALQMILCVLRTSVSFQLLPYMCSHIMPFLLGLGELREVSALADIYPQQTFVVLAVLPYTRDQLDGVIAYIDQFDVKTSAWHNVILLGGFVKLLHMKQHLGFSHEQEHIVFEFVFKLLFHEQLEVREMAANIITSIIHTWSGADLELRIGETLQRVTKILTKNKKRLQKKGTKNGTKNGDSESVAIQLHGATLALGAMVDAFPYISPIPQWLPVVLTTLSNRCSNVPGNTSKTAKATLSKFKKNRQDTWHIDIKFFTLEQLQDLEGALWTSYFV